VIQSTTTNPKH